MANAKTWFITGISSGLGRSLAEAALARGDRVAGTVRHREAAAAFERHNPDRARGLVLDVREQASVAPVLDEALIALGGHIDVVVNNAGHGLMGAVEEISDVQMRNAFETNVFGAIAVTRAVLPRLRGQGGGHLVFISSVAALIGEPPGFGMYNATKHALEGMAETLAREIAPFGLKLTMVEPGPFRTSFATSSLQQAPESDIYKESVGKTRRFIAEEFDQIGGDPDAAARAILTAVDLPDPPLRLLLGRNALEAARRQLQLMMSEIARWESLTLSVERGA